MLHDLEDDVVVMKVHGMQLLVLISHHKQLSTCLPLYMNSSPIATPAYGARYKNGAGSDADAVTTIV